MLDSLYFGKNLIRLKTVDSTNNYSTEMLKGSFVPEGSVILAEEQTRGKGQRGNTWESEAGKNLVMSLILQPKFLSLQDHFQLTMAMSLGIVDALNQHLQGADCCVKWPNDILVNRKKICGILIETSSSGSTISSAVVGIGLNVKQTVFSDPQATSMVLERSESSIEEVYSSVIFFLEKRYLQLKQGKSREQKEEYFAGLYMANKEAQFEDATGKFSGTITGITEGGLLQVKKASGVHSYALKEIKMVR